MGVAYGKFKFNIGDIISSYGRNLKIVDRKYVDKVGIKNNKTYNLHHKYYKYECLNCGNQDWLIEYLLTSPKQHIGCNACCIPPQKLLVGVNDITTTDAWMIKYFQGGYDEACNYFKYSKDKIEMVCPDCKRKHISSPHNVYSNKKLSCPCQDGWSYPNKFMYSLLEQTNVSFEAEKHFDWSEGRIYDDYIEYNGIKIITEQHGIQHYKREINLETRTLEEEIENDNLKKELAITNGITNYIVINASYSDMDFMKNSIISSGLLELLDCKHSSIDWIKCHEFATSNLIKKICLYKENNRDIPLKEIAQIFHIAYGTAIRYIKKGSKLGWCSYELFDDLRMLREQGKVITNQRPIHCISDGKYYRCSTDFVQEYEKEYGKRLNARNIRAVCEGKRNYVNNLKFEYITQEKFNDIKLKTPELVIGEFFKLKETA